MISTLTVSESGHSGNTYNTLALMIIFIRIKNMLRLPATPWNGYPNTHINFNSKPINLRRKRPKKMKLRKRKRKIRINPFNNKN